MNNVITDDNYKKISARESRKKWKKNNPSKVKEEQKRHRALHREQKRKADRKYKETHREKIRESDKLYREKRIAKEGRKNINERQRIYRREHQEQYKGYLYKKRLTNRAAAHARRARERNAPTEKFSLMDIFKRDGWVCQVCKKKVNKKLIFPHPLSRSLDHIIPISQGGGHTKGNVQLAHLYCNMSIGTGGIKQVRLF